jgi:hypothetical protein
MITIYWRETSTYATEVPLAALARALGTTPHHALDQLDDHDMPGSVDTWLAGQPEETTLTSVFGREIQEFDIQ